MCAMAVHTHDVHECRTTHACAFPLRDEGEWEKVYMMSILTKILPKVAFQAPKMAPKLPGRTTRTSKDGPQDFQQALITQVGQPFTGVLN